jgi:glycosyltransferase involved in cell wall biosynthesis
MARLKTLIFHPALAPYRVDLLNYLQDKLDLYVVFFSDQVLYHQELNQKSLRKSLKCRHDYLLRGIRILGRDLRIGMGQIIRAFEPDVVVSHEFSYATLYVMFNRKRLAKRRFGHVLWTAENVHLLGVRGFMRAALRKTCCRSVDSLVVYTHAVKDAFVRIGVPEGKLFVCGNHQDEKIFAAKIKDARSLVKRCLLDYNLLNKKVALYVGRLVGPKNLKRLIDAFARAFEQDPEAVLALIGDGPERKKLEFLVARLGIAHKVRFLGHREGLELYVWYLLAAFLVLASTSETYSAVVNEALLAGLPVLCSSYAGASVLIREGKNGHLFEPYDTEALSSLMKRTLANAPLPGSIDPPIRRNLMPISFKEGVISFVKAVEHAARFSDRTIGNCASMKK